MKFFFAVTSFFLMLMFEISSAPFITGLVLPLSFWLCVGILLFIPENQLMWFGLCAGFLVALVYSGLYPFSLIIFIVLSFIVYRVRIFFGNDGMIRYIAPIAASIGWHVVSHVLGGLLMRSWGNNYVAPIPFSSIIAANLEILFVDVFFAGIMIAVIIIREKFSYASIERYV